MIKVELETLKFKKIKTKNCGPRIHQNINAFTL